MRARPRAQVHHDPGDVLGPPEPAHGVARAEPVRAAAQLHQAVGHLGREEPGADAVDRDAAGAQLDRQVPAQVDHGGLAGRVPVGALLAERAERQPGHRRRDQHPARVRRPLRGVALLVRLLQERGEQPDRVEDGLDVQVEHLAEGAVRVRVEGLAPRGARVGEEDVHAVRVGLDPVEERLDPLDGRAVGRHRDGPGPWGQVGELVEQGHGRVAGGSFARRDEDFGTAGLEEAKLEEGKR